MPRKFVQFSLIPPNNECSELLGKKKKLHRLQEENRQVLRISIQFISSIFLTPSVSGSPLNWNCRKLGECCENGKCLFCSCSSVLVMAVAGGSTRRVIGLNRIMALVFSTPFFMLDLMVYGRNGAQTLLLRSSFETGLQCDSNFVNVIRIQKVAQMYFLNCHWYLLVMYFFVVTVLHSYLLSSFCSWVSLVILVQHPARLLCGQMRPHVSLPEM